VLDLTFDILEIWLIQQYTMGHKKQPTYFLSVSSSKIKSTTFTGEGMNFTHLTQVVLLH